jgi:hypothetical protein
MLKLVADRKMGDDIERVAKACCLRPSTDPHLLDAALALARKVVASGKDGVEMPWYHLTLGMSEYRNGNFKPADQALSAAEQAGPNTFSVNHVHVTAELYHAMSLFHQGKEVEAHLLFRQAEMKMKPLPGDDNELMAGAADHNDLVLWLAYKEAKALMERRLLTTIRTSPHL